MTVDKPYKDISSEDMLSRIDDVNKKIDEIIEANNDNMYLEGLFVEGATSEQSFMSEDVDYNLESEYMLLGTDVKALFLSVSAKQTGQSVRKQFTKSLIHWKNVDWKLVTLYVKSHEHLWVNNELNNVYKYLPKRISTRGIPPSIQSYRAKLA